MGREHPSKSFKQNLFISLNVDKKDIKRKEKRQTQFVNEPHFSITNQTRQKSHPMERVIDFMQNN